MNMKIDRPAGLYLNEMFISWDMLVGQKLVVVTENSITKCFRRLFGTLVLPDGITSIGEKAFDGCENLTAIEIPQSVTCIGRMAFSWCYSLTDVVFEDNSKLQKISDHAFVNCNNLKNINIPDNVKIADNAFGN